MSVMVSIAIGRPARSWTASGTAAYDSSTFGVRATCRRYPIAKTFLHDRPRRLEDIAMSRLPTISMCFCLLISAQHIAQSAGLEDRCSLWVDPYRGEPLDFQEVADDLASVRVVYLGEAHSLERHHELQTAILRDLAARGKSLVLGLEQLERFQQPHLERYNGGEIDFDELAKLTDWKSRWRGYDQYRGLIEAARGLEIPVLALNARAETVRQVFRSGGVEGLDDKTRCELPEDMLLKDPPYERLLNMQLMVHMAVSEERLRPMREAQISRDETMAATLAEYLLSADGKDRSAVVVCGTGHVAYSHGIPTRVRRRMPDVTDRIVVPSQSGDVELSAGEMAASRDVEITHEQLREVGRPIGDYLHVTAGR